MKVMDMMSQPITIGSEDRIKDAILKMRDNNIHQMPVLDDKLRGMIVLKDIVSKDIDPLMTKVSKLMKTSGSLDGQEDIYKAAQKLLSSGFRALPVIEKGKLIGIFSETDLLKHMNIDYDINKIKSMCECIEKTDNIGKVRNLMNEKNISRLLVLDKEKPAGVVGTMDLLNFMLNMQKSFGKLHSSKSYHEPQNIESMQVTTVMSPAKILPQNASLKDVVQSLMDNEEVFIQKEGRYFIITPKDILEIIASKPEKGAYVQISDLGNVDETDRQIIDNTTTDFVKRIGKFMPDIESLIIHIERHEKIGGKTKYSVRTRLITPVGLLMSREWGWNLVGIVQESLKILEKNALKKHEKTIEKVHESKRKRKAI